MAIKWIVLVTRTEARLYSEKTFREIAELRNDLGREKNRVMTKAKPGLARARIGTPFGVHSLTREKDPHEDVAVSFAKRVATYLAKEYARHRFDRLLVIAGPKMAGRVKRQMSSKLKRRTEWLAKNLGKVAVHDLPSAIKAAGQ